MFIMKNLPLFEFHSINAMTATIWPSAPGGTEEAASTGLAEKPG